MEGHDEPHRTHITRALGDPKRLLPWHKSCCFWMTPHGRDPVGSKRSFPPKRRSFDRRLLFGVSGTGKRMVKLSSAKLAWQTIVALFLTVSIF